MRSQACAEVSFARLACRSIAEANSPSTHIYNAWTACCQFNELTSSHHLFEHLAFPSRDTQLQVTQTTGERSDFAAKDIQLAVSIATLGGNFGPVLLRCASSTCTRMHAGTKQDNQAKMQNPLCLDKSW